MIDPHRLVDPADSCTIDMVGTKAFNLSRLISLGFNVPPCLYLATGTSPEEELAWIAAEVSERLPSTSGWAARSSATVEDLPGHSLAGRFETVFVDTLEELPSAVQEVLASSARAGIGQEQMGVVLQRLIKADHAGVAFSKDPTRDAPGVVVEGTAGMGTGVVDGIAKPWRLTDHGSDGERPNDLNPGRLTELRDGVRVLAAEFDCDVDVEWAVADDQLYWLQVRPMTGAAVEPFEVQDELKRELKGLWVRINHSLSPQAPLVVSLNPGGYLNGRTWKSQLVNGYHYVQMDTTEQTSLDDGAQDQLMDAWDRLESDIDHQLRALNKEPLESLPGDALWDVLQRRIQLARQYFYEYSDPNFISERDALEQQLRKHLDAISDDGGSPPGLPELVATLGSLTDRKNALLNKLAEKYADRTREAIEQTSEWQQFIDEFGFESASTQLFYTATLAETPDLVHAMLEDRSAVTHNDDSKWQAALDDAAAFLKGAARQKLISVTHRLRRYMLRTENDDYLLARASASVRDAILATGSILEKQHVLQTRDDVFFLTGQELRSALGGAAAANLAEHVQRRKAEFDRQSRMSPPPMIINGRPRSTRRAADAGGQFRGTPGSPGVSTGRVVVVENPFANMTTRLPANSVVVAPVLTPALAYNLAGCAALVTETGGLASHGAIVAREMGIPAVIGIPGIIGALSTGMTVSVDGTSGIVQDVSASSSHRSVKENTSSRHAKDENV